MATKHNHTKGKTEQHLTQKKHSIYPIQKISSIEGHNHTQPNVISMAPRKENNQIGKVSSSCSAWDQVLDPSTLQQWRSCSFSSSSSFLPSFLSFLLYFLAFSPLVLFSPRLASPSSNSPPLSQCLISFPTHFTNQA